MTNEIVPYRCEFPFERCDFPAFKPKTPDTFTHPGLIYCTSHWRAALVETLDDMTDLIVRLRAAEDRAKDQCKRKELARDSETELESQLIALRPVLDLMSSLAINPAIPYEFRAMMRAALGEPPLMPH